MSRGLGKAVAIAREIVKAVRVHLPTLSVRLLSPRYLSAPRFFSSTPFPPFHSISFPPSPSPPPPCSPILCLSAPPFFSHLYDVNRRRRGWCEQKKKNGSERRAGGRTRRENYAVLAARGVIMWSRSAPEQAVTFREHVPERSSPEHHRRRRHYHRLPPSARR